MKVGAWLAMFGGGEIPEEFHDEDIETFEDVTMVCETKETLVELGVTEELAEKLWPSIASALK